MSDYLDPNNEELLRDFFSEARMQVDTLEQNVLVLEQEVDHRDAVDEIFRAAHTLKGGAATVEMRELSHFTHLMEDVLDAIRSDTINVDENAVDTLLAAIDVVKAMLECRGRGAVYEEDTAAIEERLRALLPAPAPVPAPKPAAPAPAPQAPAPQAGAPPAGAPLSEEDLLDLQEAAAGLPVYRLTVTFDETSLMNTVGGIQVYAALRGRGTLLKTLPDFEALYGDTFYPVVDYFVASNEAPEALRKCAAVPGMTLAVDIACLESGGSARAPTAALPPAASPAAGAAPPADTPAAPAAAPAGRETGSVLRVDSKRVDDLLNLVSETVITKAAFNQIANQLGTLLTNLHGLEGGYRERMKALFDDLAAARTAPDSRKELNERYGSLFTLFDGFEQSMKSTAGRFRAASQNLGRITGELQEAVMRIRMVPISQIFSRFPRVVRDLSKSLNKKINLVIEGEDTELDKSVIEDLLDPIMHSVRNSCDHGIEAPDARRAAGKAEEGQLTLRACNEGSMIVIEIADDGRGIDVEAVKAKAAERGLLRANKAPSDAEAINLIFEPGFSTAQTVSDISGRGVGLDVVRRQIDKLNGTVTVKTEKGRGTTFTIKLPLTLAIIQGLLVRVGPEIYTIPITSVIESLRVRPDEIRRLDHYEVFNIRNDVISLLRISRLFGIPCEEERDYHFIVIVGTAEKKMGFMVDRLIGEEDVVIKPLRDQYTNTPGIAGASILGDGSVSLILDVGQLLDLGLSREREQREALEVEEELCA
ncbi:MAG: chemotaxis protein CheA [Treponema sp.]|jgi:two-component system chemotaxis sensor kinase CheA|nr:chemotaxis protein CheA [Treponema sp.]